MSTSIRMATSPPISGLVVRMDIYDATNALLESLTASEIAHTGIYTASVTAVASNMWARIYTADGAINTVKPIVATSSATPSSATPSPATSSTTTHPSPIATTITMQPSSAQPETGIHWRSQRGDHVDAICVRHYGTESMVMAVYEDNPNLAGMGLQLDAGVMIWLPDQTNSAAQKARAAMLWE